jgi:hypothetical protein
MDTRRLLRSNEAMLWGPADDAEADLEIMELRHIERPIRGLASRLVFVALLVLLAASIAVAGMPPRSSWYIKTPLPNLFSFDLTF